MVLLHAGGDARVRGLLGLEQVRRRILVGRDRLCPQQLPAVVVHDGPLAARRGGELGRAELAVQPRLAHQDSPQLVGVLADDVVALREHETRARALPIAWLYGDAAASARARQL